MHQDRGQPSPCPALPHPHAREFLPTMCCVNNTAVENLSSRPLWDHTGCGSGLAFPKCEKHTSLFSQKDFHFASAKTQRFFFNSLHDLLIMEALSGMSALKTIQNLLEGQLYFDLSSMVQGKFCPFIPLESLKSFPALSR